MRLLRNVLWLAAVALLGYCGFMYADSWIFQRRESERFVKALHAPSPSGELPAAAFAGVVGLIDVSRLGISVMVLEGAGESVLRRAAGHIPGTALPGQPGNVGISAHRDTFFRPLRNVRRNDIVTLRTLRCAYRYRVVSTRIVKPDDLSVLDAGPGEVLTLVTCYPFYLIGAAPGRFIVRAERLRADVIVSEIVSERR